MYTELWYFCYALLESARIRQIKVILEKLRNSDGEREVGGRRRGAKEFQTVLQPLNYRYRKGDWNDCLIVHRFYIHWLGSSELSLNEFNVVSKMEELKFCDRVGLDSDVRLQYRIHVHHSVPSLPLHLLYKLRISYALIRDNVGLKRAQRSSPSKGLL